MTCLDERRLLEVHLGDGGDADRAHLAGCAGCTARLEALAHDLGRIDTVLRSAPPRQTATRPELGWRLVAVAAALLLIVAVARRDRVSNGDDTITFALADELATTIEADLWSDAADSTARPRSTCAWGDPLLGVGCDEPAVTQIAWR